MPYMSKRTKQMIKPLLLLLAAVLFSAPAGAVLKERDLSKTLRVLCAELEYNYQREKRFIDKAQRRSQARRRDLVALTQSAQQISLMLYSLPQDYVFDITYSCGQASDLYNEFNKNMKNNATSFNYSHRLREDIKRYDGLISALENLPPAINNSKTALETLAATDSATASKMLLAKTKIDTLTQKVKENQPYMLTDSEQQIRKKCIMYAKALRNNYMRFYNYTKADEIYYKEVEATLIVLNEYAQKQYEKLRDGLMERGGDDYFKVLTSLSTQFQSGTHKVKEKYKPLDTESDWRGPVVLYVSVLIIFYMAIASLLSYLLIILLPKIPCRLGRYIRSKRVYQDKMLMISYAVGMAIFAIAIGMVKFTIVENHLVIMATSFMYIFAWLFFVITLSLIIRHSGKRMTHGFASYLPFLFMTFLVIVMRIVFMPLSIIALVFPPVILCTTIWQIFNLRRHRPYLAKSDLVFSNISLMSMIYSTALSWTGYTLAAVESIIWWSFLLTFILTVACIHDLVGNYENTRFMARLRYKNNIPETVSDEQLLTQMRKGDFVESTWLCDFIRMVLVPILGIGSFIASVIFEADFFNSAGQCREYFETNFVDIPDVVQLSVMKICVAAGLFFIFRYVLHISRSCYRLTKERDAARQNLAQANITLANNIMTILAWGFYLIFCLVLFNVPKSGISAISAGLATGLGFAMKDLLENFFYGISLMAGRVRVGDFIECDGTFGHVESITYQSTQVITIDGSTVAFLNKSLFSKNFSNLTRHTSYTLVKLPVGVAYGTNVAHVRKVLTEHLDKFYAEYMAEHPDMRLPMIDKSGFGVIFKDFGDSSVDLFVKYRVLVEHRIVFNAMVKEQMYIALNNAGIEIPFPQRDLHIIRTAAAE